MRFTLLLLRLLLRTLFGTLRLIAGVTLTVLRTVTLMLMWILAPQACFAAWLFRG